MGEIADRSYVITDVKPTIISGLGAIPKPDSSEVRFIRDCSRPPWRAFNDYISCSSFKFQTLENAIKMEQANYFMAKIDLPHAYLLTKAITKQLGYSVILQAITIQLFFGHSVTFSCQV